ncbi:hypothetical protein [Nocardioides sp. NPDC006273]|uniref:hypothetical protein n=1 Tax=Nocardioides sp. NPDC006273 TaxID=3155598 RepID=UPI0033AD0909
MSSHRLDDVLGMSIRFADGRGGGRVLDLRLTPSQRVSGPLAELVVEGVIAGRARPGTLFGYDRHQEQGPWLIRVIIRALHRHTGYVAWDDVDRIDWDAGILHLRVNQLAELS